MMPAPDTTANAIAFVRSIQAGQLNGIKPADCGPFADILTEAARTFEQAGIEAGLKVIATNPELLTLTAGGSEPTTPSALFPTYTLAAGLGLPEPYYLVYGVIGEGDTGMIYGDAASGKTYLAIDLAVSLAAGVPWMGRWEVGEPHKVLYFISEGRRRFFRRVQAAVNGMRARGYDTTEIYRLVNENLVIVTEVPQLFEKNNASHVSEYIKLWQNVSSPLIDIVFIDTLHRASVGAEENSSKDAGVVVDSVTRLQSQMNCAAIMIHHSNKTGGYRGSTAYRGNVDFVFKVEGVHRKPRRLTIDKLRDGEQDGPVEGIGYVSVFQVDQASSGTYCTWPDDTAASELTDKFTRNKLQALGEIREALGGGPLSINQLAAKVQAVSKNTAKCYIQELVTDGEIVTKPGPKNSLLCSLTQFG